MKTSVALLLALPLATSAGQGLVVPLPDTASVSVMV